MPDRCSPFTFLILLQQSSSVRDKDYEATVAIDWDEHRDSCSVELCAKPCAPTLSGCTGSGYACWWLKRLL